MITGKTFSKHLQTITAALRHNKETIAVAESVTSGLLQYALSTTPHASAFFQGGITAFNLGQKAKHLDIEPIQAACCNCVSEEVAQQMALGAQRLFKSIWGVGITGYATPVSQSGNEVFCYYAISKDHTIIQSDKVSTSTLEGEEAQYHFIKQVIAALQKTLSS